MEDPKNWSKAKAPRFARLSSKEKMFFTKYLAALTQAGIPLDRALLAIHNQTKSTSMHHILHVVLTDIASGEFLSTSLKKFPHAFDPLIVNLIEVGEQSGTLTESLFRIAEHIEKTRELKGKIRGALLYPIIVICGTLGIATYLVLVLLPQLLPLFTSLNIDLPWTTRVVLAISNFLITYSREIAFSVVAGIIGFILLMRIKAFRLRVDWLLLKLPLIGPLITKVQVTQLASVMGTMLKAGMTIVESLRVASGSLTNLVYQRGLAAIADSIQEGESISIYLSKHKQLFPGFVVQMIAVGEETGKLDESFLYIANFSEREVDDATKTLTTVLEPALLITVGLFVGFIAISIITPIYSLSGGIKP